MSPGRSSFRILHILAPADFGGLERVVRTLVRAQRARGHRVRVLAIVDRDRERDHPLVCELTADGVDVDITALPPRAYRSERRAVREALDRYPPDVVHTHGARVDVLDAPVARHAGFPVVTTVHGFTGGGLKNRFYELLQRRAMRRAHAVVAVSAVLAADLVAAGVPAERVYAVPNAWAGGGKVAGRAEARERLGIGDVAGPLLGWVGRLTREKGADVFIQAVARLADRTIRAVVVGTGREREQLERQAAGLGIHDRVHWAGTVQHADRFLSAFDVFVMSSRTEGTPIVLFEAMAAGVPVVTTAVGGIPNVVSSSEAMLVPPEDAEQLADVISRTLADPDGARARAAAARRRLATHFAVEPWLDRYDEIYRSVIPRARAVGQT